MPNALNNQQPHKGMLVFTQLTYIQFYIILKFQKLQGSHLHTGAWGKKGILESSLCFAGEGLKQRTLRRNPIQACG